MLLSSTLAGGAELKGTVKDGAGKLVSGAQFVLTQDDNVFASPNEAAAKRDKQTVSARSAADGTFTVALARPSAKYALGVAHDAGYAEFTEKTFPDGGAVELKPWGRVEGKILRAGKPVAGAVVHTSHLIRRGRPWVSFDMTTKSDREGKFKFDRAVPGFVAVNVEEHDVEMFGRFAEVQAGKTARVEFGGTGCVVVGRVNLPQNGEIKFDKSLFQSNGFLTHPQPPDFYGEHADREDPHGKAYENELAWRGTEEGKAHLRKFFGVGFTLKPDGTFRVEDVPPGDYDVQVSLEQRNNGTPLDDEGPVVEMERKITVPEGSAEKEVDLGALEPDKVRRNGL